MCPIPNAVALRVDFSWGGSCHREAAMATPAGSDDSTGQNDAAGEARFVLLPSLPGLTRPSIHFERLLRRVIDARVKPAHDASLVASPLESVGWAKCPDANASGSVPTMTRH